MHNILSLCTALVLAFPLTTVAAPSAKPACPKIFRIEFTTTQDTIQYSSTLEPPQDGLAARVSYERSVGRPFYLSGTNLVVNGTSPPQMLQIPTDHPDDNIEVAVFIGTNAYFKENLKDWKLKPAVVYMDPSNCALTIERDDWVNNAKGDIGAHWVISQEPVQDTRLTTPWKKIRAVTP